MLAHGVQDGHRASEIPYAVSYMSLSVEVFPRLYPILDTIVWWDLLALCLPLEEIVRPCRPAVVLLPVLYLEKARTETIIHCSASLYLKWTKFTASGTTVAPCNFISSKYIFCNYPRFLLTSLR